jgi:hypothetical protein
MAITTPDGIIAGAQPPQMFFKAVSGILVAGRPFSPFYTAGIPGPAAAPTSGVDGGALTTYGGQIPFTNPVSGNSYLARFSGWAAQSGLLLLCDRLWHNSGLSVTSTSGQSITFPTLPARDANGTTDGDGVLIGMEIVTATGAGANVPTISYTDQDGNSGATGNMLVTYASSSAIGTFYPFTLAAGDTGVRSVQTFTNSVSMTSGSISLVAYRVLATLDITTSGGSAGPFELGLPRMYDDTVPFLLFIPSTTTTTNLHGSVVVTQG